MNTTTLTPFEAAARAWLADRDDAYLFDQPTRLPNGELAIDYWHTVRQCYGLLIVTDAITETTLPTLITATEFHIARRQQRDMEAAIAEGTPADDARSAAYGYPTAAAICIEGDHYEYEGGTQELYQRASGTFDEPLVIGVWGGSRWTFEEESAV